MVLDFNAKYVLNCRFYILNSWIAKFYNFSRIGADNVIVLFTTMGFFEL